MNSGLRITHISKIGEEVRTNRVPAQRCAGLRTGNMGVPPGEEPEEAEMLLGLFRCDRNDRHVQATADGGGNLFQRHTLFGDGVVPGSRFELVQSESVESGDICYMRGRPAVLTIADIR